MGWLTRKFGLTADNLVSAEVVLADGQVLRASGSDHPDLFWAVRGGGGNFGVVSELSSSCTSSIRPSSSACSSGASTRDPRCCGWAAGSAPFVPEEHRLAPGYVMLVVGFDGTPEHAGLVQRIRDEVPPLFDMVTPMPHTQLQQLLDEANDFGFYCYTKPGYVDDLSDGVGSQRLPPQRQHQADVTAAPRAAPLPEGPYLNTTVLLPCTSTRSSRCQRSPRASTSRSMSRPRRTMSATVSPWSTRITSCSTIGPPSRFSVT
jgi:hypothetical protein